MPFWHIQIWLALPSLRQGFLLNHSVSFSRKAVGALAETTVGESSRLAAANTAMSLRGVPFLKTTKQSQFSGLLEVSLCFEFDLIATCICQSISSFIAAPTPSNPGNNEEADILAVWRRAK